MAKYILTNKAVKDLSDIWNYTFDSWSEAQADIYYKMLIEVCIKIAENPDIGKHYEGIFKSVFGFKAGRHIIFFKKINTNKIEVIRILHEKMDLKSRILRQYSSH